MSLRNLTLLLLITALALPSSAESKDDKKVLVRVYAGPVIGIYHNNEDYTISTRARASVNAGLRFEYMFNGYSSLCAAAEYLTHSLSFDSYYFAPGQLPVYDKKFPYTHRVRLHEAQLPILFKYNFVKENDKALNSYLLAGWGYRYIMTATSDITPVNSNYIVWSGTTGVTMEYKLFTPRGGSMLLAGAGFERNYQNQRRAIYGEMIFKYGLSRFEYPGSGTAAPFFIKDSFLCINVGCKF